VKAWLRHLILRKSNVSLKNPFSFTLFLDGVKSGGDFLLMIEFMNTNKW